MSAAPPGERVRRLAAALEGELGVRAGSAAALALGERPERAEVLAALELVGAHVDEEAPVLFIDAWREARAALRSGPPARTVVAVGFPPPRGAIAYEALIAVAGG